MPTPALEALHELRQRLSSAKLDQTHLFKDWPSDPRLYDSSQLRLLTELHEFTYPGGIEAYIRCGKCLLAADGAGGNAQAAAFQKLEQPPLMYTAPDLFAQSAELAQLEASGAALTQKCVYVLVAGGLGERLGYSDIKAGLPVETATRRSYLQHYLDWAKAAAGSEVPFVIMTSDDTHARTVELIDELRPNMPNLRLLKQETVPCFADADAHLAVDEADRSRLLRKPHGHGDVHALIHAARAAPDDSSRGGGSLIDSWCARGCEYVVFFQDTNAPAVLTIPISLAVSARERLDMNFTCIPRMPKEAIGLLCRSLRREKDADDYPRDAWRTAVVEYNVFEDVAKTLTVEGGDVAAAGSEFSPFPGSINTLVLRLEPYREVLAATAGVVPEFINPKFADSTRTTFKKPARVESLMQDVALLFDDSRHRVGGTVFTRFTYQPVKNALATAAGLAAQGMSTYCPASAEEAWLALVRRRLRAVGVRVNGGSAPGEEGEGGDAPAQPRSPDFIIEGGIPVHLRPIICIDADTALGGAARGIGGLGDLARLFPHPERVSIAADSTLFIKGRVVVDSLRLNGALQLLGPHAGGEERPLTVSGLDVDNKPWTVRAPTPEDTHEVDRIRGYILEKSALQVYCRESESGL